MTSVIHRNATRLRARRFAPLSLLVAATLTTVIAQDDPVTLQYWHAYGGAIGVAHQELVDEFNAIHPDIHVDAAYGGTLWTMRDGLTAALAAGAAPDLASIDQFWVAEFAEGGYTVPVEQLATLGPDLELAGVLPQFLDAGRFRSELHAVPFAVSTVVLYYNRDLLQEFGLSDDDLPETWTDLLELTARLDEARAAQAPGPWILGTPTTAQTGVVYHYILTLWQHGGEIFDDDGGAVAFAAEPGVRALELWQELVAHGAIDLAAPDRAWESGRQLFQMASSAHLTSTYGALPFDVGVTSVPMADYRVTGIGGRSLAVLTPEPDRQRAAAAFLAWMISADVNRRWSLATGYNPLRREGFGSAAYQAALRADPRLERVLHEMLYARLRPSHVAYGEVSRVLGEAIESALYRAGDATVILQDAAVEADELIRGSTVDR